MNQTTRGLANLSVIATLATAGCAGYHGGQPVAGPKTADRATAPVWPTFPTTSTSTTTDSRETSTTDYSVASSGGPVVAANAVKTQGVRASRNRPTSTPAGTSGGTSNAVEACIIARENGGSYSRGSNPTHFGRYQYSRPTWQANGGNPNTWGTASPAEQDAVFRSTVNASGYRSWRQWDGC